MGKVRGLLFTLTSTFVTGREGGEKWPYIQSNEV